MTQAAKKLTFDEYLNEETVYTGETVIESRVEVLRLTAEQVLKRRR